MAYFIPSYIQKRLLRYALSRLEVLDADALDLEHLEIEWGRKSTIELHDVQLRRAKLGSLLHLPPTLSVERARVGLLRVTVPADIHTSSIVVDIRDVETRLQLHEDETSTETSLSDKLSRQKRPRGKTPSTNGKRALASRQDSTTSSEDSELLPDPQSLAQSFLEDEPQVERDQLEAVFNAKSVDLGQSTANSDAGSDEIQTGTGVGISLPGFLADFLRGVGDRLQVIITNVSIKFDVYLQLTTESGTRLSAASQSSAATFSVTLENLDVQDASNIGVELGESIAEHSSFPQRPSHFSKRRNIKLKGITGSVTTDANVFESLSMAFDKAEDVSRSQSTAHPAMNDSNRSSPVLSRSSTVPFEAFPEFASRVSESSSAFRRASKEEMSLGSASDMDASFSTEDITRSTDSMFQSEDVAATMEDSQSSQPRRMYDALRSFREERLSTSQNTIERPLKHESLGEATNQSVAGVKASSSSSLIDSTLFHSMHEPGLGISSLSAIDKKESGIPSPGLPAGTPTEEDLAESKYFTHEEAKSIYLSAVYDRNVPEDQAQELPGQWKDDYASTDDNGDLRQPAASSDESSPHIQAAKQSVSIENVRQEQGTSDTESPPFINSITHSFCGPNAVAIDIFHASEMTIEISEVREDRDTKDTTLSSDSEYRNVPGAFSMYAEKTTKSQGFVKFAGHASRSEEQSTEGAKTRSMRSNYDLAIGDIITRIDAAMARLVLQFFRKLQSALGTGSKKNADIEYDHTATKQDLKTSLSFSAQSFIVAFTERLRLSEARSDSKPLGSSWVDDSLFVLKLKSTKARFPDSTETSNSKISVSEISFGFPGDDIVCSQRRKGVHASLLLCSKRESRQTSTDDVQIEVQPLDGSLDVHIVIQPLALNLDMQKIDSTLGSIGGLSGLLELGSSIMTDSTVVSTVRAPAASVSTRSVRFDASAKQPSEAAHAPHDAHLRVNMRIGGSHVTLLGQSYFLTFESTAIKMVSRSSLVGVQIDEMKFYGPQRLSDFKEPPVSVAIRDTRLKFLPNPGEHDLTRLISLLTPSKDRFQQDDDFLVDTLVKQRKKGAVMRCNISRIDLECADISAIKILQGLSLEMSKLSAVTKYLPQETRPGLMTLATVDVLAIAVDTRSKIGEISVDIASVEVAHVSAPSLVALSAGSFVAHRGRDDRVLSVASPEVALGYQSIQPMLMLRMIEDELEPTIKIKLWNFCFEYSVPLVIALTEYAHEQDARNASEVAPPTESSAIENSSGRLIRSTATATPSNPAIDVKPLRVDIVLKDCALGLKPHNLPSKAMLVLEDASIVGYEPDKTGFKAHISLHKAATVIIDNVSRTEKGTGANVAPSGRNQPVAAPSSIVRNLCQQGYVCVNSISAAQAHVFVAPKSDGEFIELEVKDELFVLETCADSQQTLIELLNGLKPPSPPSTGQRYRTEVAPIQDMMASFTGEAFPLHAKKDVTIYEDSFTQEESTYDDDQFHMAEYEGFEEDSSDMDQDFHTDTADDEIEDSIYGGLGLRPLQESKEYAQSMISDPPVQSSLNLPSSISGSFEPTSLPPPAFGQAKKWDSANNRYIPVARRDVLRSPVQIHIKDVHVIWNLYDGYDWEGTRDTITKAVQDVEARAEEKRRSRRVATEEDDNDSVIGDFLFNSIYIGVSANQDPRELSRQINRDIDDLISETGSHAQSHAPSHSSSTTSRPSSSHRPHTPGRKLRLHRSKRHKIAFEVRGLSADIFMFEPDGETQSSVDVRIVDFEIFDHVPTSTWKKFLTYQADAGPREDKKPMIHLEICDVRPVPELTASELVIRATILPLRLHVDQDALDFITRFFEFKSINGGSGDTTVDEPFLQRVEVRPVRVKLDYKPKKVDYAGIRSGRTSEFMNFFILDGAEFVLRHVILYGCSGFLKMHHSLEDVWMPDVKTNQLPSVLSGLNGVRTLVNVGSGVRDLIQIPIREYRKDGRIVRSISKGALSFARTTGGELTRFGAKLAIGAQTALQGAEGLFTRTEHQDGYMWEDADLGPEERRAISHYANQPTGILQGLTGAAKSLERDLLVTRDVIIAISGEVRESRDVEGVARAVARHAPTLILRPMIGASKALAQTLMGAGNTVDPDNKRRVEDKYKRY